MPKYRVVIIAVAGLAALILLSFGGFIFWLNANEYKPVPREDVSLSRSPALKPVRGQPIEAYSWNIGYGGLDASQDFFMDGGKGVRPASARNVEENIWAIQAFLSGTAGDIIFLQEVDVEAKRSYEFDEAGYFSASWKGSSAFAPNYKCKFVPVPFPRFMGRVESGLLTLNSYGAVSAERIALPGAFSWPTRLAQLKRCLLVERVPVQDSNTELVLVNLHLEAYDEGGSGRIEQTRMLAEFLKAQYAAGNYCVAGGDFNQAFPQVKDLFPAEENKYFTPGIVDESLFGEGWTLAADIAPSCRSLDKPYKGREGHQMYIIDGFITSPNVNVISVQTQDLEFRNSDHNPVKLTFTLK